jgi:SCY1-like protein 1
MLPRWFVTSDVCLQSPPLICIVQPETSVTDGATSPGGLTSAIPTQSTLVNSAAGAAGALAGWAISSLGRKVNFLSSPREAIIYPSVQLATADLQSVMTSAPLPETLTLSMQAADAGNENSFPGSFSAATSIAKSTTIITSSAPSRSMSSTTTIKAMQLGKKDTSSAALVAELTEEVVKEEADSNPWATDDLIDINADQDDWSE